MRAKADIAYHVAMDLLPIWKRREYTTGLRLATWADVILVSSARQRLISKRSPISSADRLERESLDWGDSADRSYHRTSRGLR